MASLLSDMINYNDKGGLTSRWLEMEVEVQVQVQVLLTGTALQDSVSVALLSQ